MPETIEQELHRHRIMVKSLTISNFVMVAGLLLLSSGFYITRASIGRSGPIRWDLGALCLFGIYFPIAYQTAHGVGRLASRQGRLAALRLLLIYLVFTAIFMTVVYVLVHPLVHWPHL